LLDHSGIGNKNKGKKLFITKNKNQSINYKRTDKQAVYVRDKENRTETFTSKTVLFSPFFIYWNWSEGSTRVLLKVGNNYPHIQW
jgi:hypothetical protein